MKKVLALFLAAVMTLSLAACGGKDADKDSSGDAKPSQTEGSDQDSSGDVQQTQEPDAGSNVGVTDARTLLTAIWDSYGEDEKFPAMGGDLSEENMVDGAPGTYGLEDTATLDQYLGLPEVSAAMIDDAASLMHMMNANTFTCGAFHVSTADNLSAVADSLKENILARQWMCGFPDKLIVIAVDDYVISAFGNEELIDNFKEKALAAYGTARLLYEEPIA